MGFKEVFRFGPPKDDDGPSSKSSGSDASKGKSAKKDASDEPLSEQHGWTAGANMATKATVGVLWLALLAGPLALAMRFLAPPTPQYIQAGAGAEQNSQVAAVSEFATEAVIAWLETPAENGGSDIVAQYFGDLDGTRPQYPWITDDVAVANVIQLDNGLWSVTVGADVTAGQRPTTQETPPVDGAAAQTADPSTEGDGQEDSDEESDAEGDEVPADLYEPRRMYFKVPIYLAPDGSMRAQALPAPTAEPGRADAQPQPYGASLGNAHPVYISVSEFLTAMLTSGSSDRLERYSAPGSTFSAVVPAPYTQIAIVSLKSTTDPGTDQTLPTDGQTLEVLATIRVSAANEQSLETQYALTLTAREQRWEISALHDSPALVNDVPVSPDGAGTETGAGTDTGTGNETGGGTAPDSHGSDGSGQDDPAGGEGGAEDPSTEPPTDDPTGEPSGEPPATTEPPADQPSTEPPATDAGTGG